MSATTALGLTLVHFLWQGVAVAGILALLLAATARCSASTRYGLSLAALGVMLVLPIVTGFRLISDSPSAPLTLQSATAVDVAPADLTSSVAFEGSGPVHDAADHSVPLTHTESVRARRLSRDLSGIRRFMEPALPWMVLFWFAGVLALSLRLLGGWAHSQRLTRTGTRPTSERIRRLFDRLVDRMQVENTVKVVESAIVQVPAVVGWLRPVVLLPVSAAAGLSPQQLEALLAHEIAHIRRNDYLVNLLQTVVETLLFYHPAVWWVSGRVREERENCCDDLAVAVTGDVRIYAGALAELEYLRAPAAQLVAAARGGSLLGRVQRLLDPSGSDARLRPRWLAGAIAVTAALLIGGGARLSGLDANEAVKTLKPEVVGIQGASDAFRFALAEALDIPAIDLAVPEPGPVRTVSTDTAIVHSGDGPLENRWDWALDVARHEDFDAYWVGYAIAPNPNLEGWIRVKQSRTLIGGGTYVSGRLMGDMQGFNLPGVDLETLVAERRADNTAVFFGFESDGRGRPRLTEVYISSFALPVDLDGLPLVWLVDAEDDESVSLVRGLYDGVRATRTKEILVSAVGIHTDSRTVVPVLIDWLEGDEPNDVREEAADWLGYHPTRESLYALARAARRDPNRDVQEESAEAIGHLDLPAATDTLISLARSLRNRDLRSEAVEALGERDDPRTTRVLASIARSDRSSEVQEEAIETLSEVSGSPETVQLLMEIADSHPSVDAQCEAVEALGELRSAAAVEKLTDIAREHPRSEVRREAVEALGETRSEAALPILIEMAEGHPDPEVQEEAIEAILELAPRETAIEVLSQIAVSGSRVNVQQEAVEALGEIRDRRALTVIAEIARNHRRPAVRDEALETYADVAPADSAVNLLMDIVQNDASPVVQEEAVEALAELGTDAAIDAIIEIAGTHPNRQTRVEAVEYLAESSHPRAEAAIRRLVGRP